MQFSSPQHAADCIANSKRVLAMPAVTYPNGRNSHEAHREIWELAADYLMDQQEISWHAVALSA